METSLFTALLKAYWKTAVAIVLAAALAWWIEGLRWDADVSKRNEAHTAALKKQSDQAVIDLTNQQKRTEAAQAALAALDAKHTKEMADEQAKNDRLRADVAAGTRRVRIAAANLATSQLIRDTTSGTGSLGDAVQIDLTPAGGSAVLSLRESTSRDDQVIQYLQGYIAEVVKQRSIK
ncbi:prophage endopeptidase [Rahnella sp. BIGb0236]|uniref:lysis system i-spanin subunit Rz n=1 Tax=Rahnella sp. BIGb0236 TaxID=2485117 RepID=UPI00105FA63B|nr:lysis system i-spanin subunit Rz [Rahnella sp. BIGb0236]TDS97731.1 prophage endopeptidase [Rahnella sp. BIGb0236]